MAFEDYEIATLFGALDSDAFTNSGRRYSAFSAHYLRQMALNHNRMMTKEQLLFNLWWPVVSTTSGNDVGSALPFSGNASLAWDLIHPPIPIFKLPGSSLMNIRMTAQIGASSDATHTSRMFFQFVTLASGGLDPSADDSSAFVVAASQATQDGFVSIDLDGVPIDPGEYEELAIYVRGDASTNLAPTATYGTPNTGQLIIGTNSDDQIVSDHIIDGDADWNLSGGVSTDNLADAGFLLQFEDSAGTIIIPPRRITSVTTGVSGNLNGTALYFDPHFTAWEEEVVKGFGGHYSIVAGATWAIGNIMGYSQARTT